MKRLTLIFTIFFGFISVSLGSESLPQLREDITQRVKNIVSVFDYEASVDVTFKTKSSKQKETPFLIAGPSNTRDASMIKEADIVIYTKKDPSTLPENMKGQIQQRMREYPFPVSYSYKFIEVPVEVASEESKEVLLTPFQKYFLWGFALFGLMVTMFGGFSLRVLSQKGSKQELGGSGIPESLEAIRKSIESFSGFGSQPMGESASVKVDVKNSNENLYIQMGIDGIHQVLMDCYWSKEDNYAAFVWENIPVSMKTNLLEKEGKLVSYANYISQLKGEDFGHLREPYYLFPLSLEKIDNEGLTKLVKSYKSIFRMLPKLRTNFLGLSATEKKELLLVNMSQKETELEIKTIKWNKFETVEARDIPSQNTFYFKDDWEEEVFFQDTNNIDFSLVEVFPSLVWLTFLEDSKVRKILNGYSAKELALAWVGPKMSLRKLESILDAEKVELLNAYVQKVVPSRKSKVFHSIIKNAIPFFDTPVDAEAA
ncbi:MAG: hypothetical protein NXH75_05855 [Halobacteriovoraceae bacterium]|nr:hypothetical protein [Halobacteriovoraceae bacterium]